MYLVSILQKNRAQPAFSDHTLKRSISAFPHQTPYVRAPQTAAIRGAGQTQIHAARLEAVERSNAKPKKVWIVDAPISKKVYAHDPALPRSTRTYSMPTIVVTNRDRVRLESLGINDQYDYDMEIDAAGMIPETWRHAGLPPNGMFTPEFPWDPCRQSQHRYSDYGGFAILAMAACNLVMRRAALSDSDPKPARVKSSLKPGRPMRCREGAVSVEPPTFVVCQWDELDEKRMAFALGMLVRLFYRGGDETGDRDLREQELRKAVIMYVAGTGGANQFANFASMCMAMELAAGFAKSVGVGPDDQIHKDMAGLSGDAMRGGGAAPVEPISDLAKVCRKILGDRVVGRVEEYPRLNNRLKHYGRGKDAEYFYSNVGKITETMRRLRADAAYVILLGLVKLYGAEGMPEKAGKNRRTSSIILGMLEDCLDRHGAGGSDGIVEKIRRLEAMVENEAVKDGWDEYYVARSVLYVFRLLVGAAETLDAPDVANGMRALVWEYEGAMPKAFKPSKYALVGEYTDTALHAWLVNVMHEVVTWVDDEFDAVHEMLWHSP